MAFFLHAGGLSSTKLKKRKEIVGKGGQANGSLRNSGGAPTVNREKETDRKGTPICRKGGKWAAMGKDRTEKATLWDVKRSIHQITGKKKRTAKRGRTPDKKEPRF